MNSSKELHTTPYDLEIDGFILSIGSRKKAAQKPWIRQFCNLERNKWYIKIDKDWISDWFNQYGIEEDYQHFKEAMQLITDNTGSSWLKYREKEIRVFNNEATEIYGRMHARYICQPRGLELMQKKYENGEFGKCPRFNCNGTNLLPIGTTLKPLKHSLKFFCPMCNDIYRINHSPTIDGAHFGPAFAHIFISSDLKFDKSHEFKRFIPKAFGFPIKTTSIDMKSPHFSNINSEEYIDNNLKQ